MVAISLYRGNLHRVPDVPRQWLMPNPKISVKDFKSLLSRRNRALSCLRSPNPIPNSNANPTLIEQPTSPQIQPSPIQLELKTDPDAAIHPGEGQVNDHDQERGRRDKEGRLDGEDCSGKPVEEQTMKAAPDAVGADGNLQAVGKLADGTIRNAETINNRDSSDDKERKKRDVEEKLQILNAKKHNLVQVLKQILNAEEELKRRNSVPGIAMRPSVPLQTDGANDSGSMTRHLAARIGSETNLGGDIEAGEAEDVSNHNIHSRHVLRMSSMSPSSESPLRKSSFQHNMVPHPSRANLGGLGSPSRFAPTGQQSHSGNLAAVSVSGTNYIASSPCPAASGGTSVSRDAGLPSPWN